MSTSGYWRLGLALTAALCCQPANAQKTDDPVAEAMNARKTGDFPRAIAILETQQHARPEDPTVLRLLGSTYAFAGRYSEAIATLTRAHSLAPRDSDISLALGRAYLWSGNYRAARETADAISANDPGNAELPALVQSIDRARSGDPGASPRPLIGLSQSVSDVRIGGGHSRWYETTATLAIPLSRRLTVSWQADREERATSTDTVLHMRVDRRFGAGAVGYLAISGTPNANFRERWGLRGGGEILVARPVALSIDLRYADYGTTTIAVAEPGIRLRTPDDRFSLAIKSINLWGEAQRHQSGWSLRGEAQPIGPVRLFGGGASYPDTEAGITRRVRSVFAGAMAPVDARLALRLTVEHEVRVASYTRNSAILGASWHF